MLPKEFKPDGLYELIRLGKNNDGGYLVCKNSIEVSDYLISFGISDDFSFEEDFKDKKNIPIFAYDPTTTNIFFLKKILINILKIKLKSLFKSIYNFIKFKIFFNNKNNFFIKNKIGKGGSASFICTSVKEVVKNTNNAAFIFFKIDIEGSEYRILDDIIEYRDRISGIAIEFHDVDCHLDKIVKFIKNINLTLVHIHANNYSEYNYDNIPTALELSFSKNPKMLDRNLSLPHLFDQKNNPDSPDLELSFIK